MSELNILPRHMGTPFLLFPLLLPYTGLHSLLLATNWDRTHRSLVAQFPKSITTFKAYVYSVDTILRRNRELLKTIPTTDLSQADSLTIAHNISKAGDAAHDFIREL